MSVVPIMFMAILTVIGSGSHEITRTEDGTLLALTRI